MIKIIGKFSCFVDGNIRLYPIKGIKPNIDYNNIDVEIVVNENQLTLRLDEQSKNETR